MRKGERCIALDSEAKRCRKAAKVAVYFHGDAELLHAKVQWVRAAFCEQHYD